MRDATKTRLGRLEARHMPDTPDIAIVASQAETDRVVKDALNAGRRAPLSFLPASHAAPTWLSWCAVRKSVGWHGSCRRGT